MSILVVLGAGFAAGMVNTIVGSGSLISYPALVFAGLSPVSANIANTVGLVPGSFAGAWGYRTHLRKIGGLLAYLVPASILGGVVGAFLLAELPDGAFTRAVPVLILVSSLLVALQPKLIRLQRMRRDRPVSHADDRLSAVAIVAIACAGIYGGYFSASQGVILLGLLGVFIHRGLQVENAVKNLLQAVVNAVAATYFIVSSTVAWDMALAISISSLGGALAGASIAQRIPPRPFRIAIVIFGMLMTVMFAAAAFADS